MALRIKKEITQALEAARNGDAVDLSQITIPRLSGGHMIKAAADAGAMVRDFFLSDKSVDRDRDTLAGNGWVLNEFKANGTVLWAHNGWAPPIAEPVNTRIQGKGDGAKLFSGARFIDSDPMSAAILNLIDEKILKAVSVGFIPLEWVVNEERRGLDFTKQKLLEFSPVPVGSHPGAMVQLAKDKGLDLLPILEWSQRWLDNDELVGKAVADDVEVAAIYKALSPYARKSDGGVLFFDAKGAPSTSDTTAAGDGDGSTRGTDDAEAKAGRVLSKKNQSKLAKASDLVLEVLADAKKEDDEDDEDEEHPKASIELVVRGIDAAEKVLVKLELDDETRAKAEAALSAARDALDPPEVEPMTVEDIEAAVRAGMAEAQGPTAEDVAAIVRTELAAEREAEKQANIRRQTGRLPD